MLVKIITSAIIIICCSLLGIQMSYRYTRRIYNIRILRTILSQLETEIIHYSTLLSQALTNSIRSLDGEWIGFFLNITKLLEDADEYSLDMIWDKSLKTLQRDPYVGKEEYEIMYRFGTQLGSSDKESQAKYFHLAQEQLRTAENSAQAIKSKYSRMYCNLGVLLGITIAIILF